MRFIARNSSSISRSMPGSQDFHGARTVRRFHAMNLRHRGRGNRIAEIGEQRVRILAELFAQRLQRLRFGEGRDRILEAREIGRRLDADHVRPCRHELAELDPRGPELLQRSARSAAPAALAAAARQDAQHVRPQTSPPTACASDKRRE